MISPPAFKSATSTDTSTIGTSSVAYADAALRTTGYRFEQTRVEDPKEKNPIEFAHSEDRPSFTSVDVEKGEKIGDDDGIAKQTTSVSLPQLRSRHAIPGMLHCELLEVVDNQIVVWAAMPNGMKVKAAIPRGAVESAGLPVRSLLEFGWVPDTGEVVPIDLRDPEVMEDIETLRARRKPGKPVVR